MRQYAWYSPEFNVIVLQAIIDECYIAFEWENLDMYEVSMFSCPDDQERDPMTMTTWIPLGEV